MKYKDFLHKAGWFLSRVFFDILLRIGCNVMIKIVVFILNLNLI